MKENKNYWSGLTDNYIKVSTQNNNNIRNTITNVKLNYENLELTGKLIN